MAEYLPLSHFSTYAEERISADSVSIEQFVTTDNLRPNRGGVELSTVYPKGTLVCYQEGDILIGNIRPYLKKIWFSNRCGGCSQDVLVIRPKPGVNKLFLYYALYRDDFFIHMMNGKKGTKMPRGDKDHIMGFYIPKFSIQSQNKISDILGAIDSKIETNTSIIKELEIISQALYHFWFVQFDFPNGEGHPYKLSGGEMMYNKILKRHIPANWEVKSLYDIAEFMNGAACQKFPLKKDDSFLPVIKIKEMSEGFSRQTEKVCSDIPSKYVVDDGDVLFSWSATLDVKIWHEGRGALNQHIFKVTSDEFPKSFYYFEMVNYLEHFKMMARLRKTTMGHITKDHLIESRIPVPPLPLIKQLDDKLKPIFQTILFTHKQNQELARLRDWLLPILMNGQVSVGAAYEQVKEVLIMAAEV